MAVCTCLIFVRLHSHSILRLHAEENEDLLSRPPCLAWHENNKWTNVVKIPITSVRALPDELSSRELTESHVEEMMAIISKNGNQTSMHPITILFSHFGDHPPDNTAKFEAALVKHGGVPIAGNHRFNAIWRLHKKFPKNLDWQFVWVVVVCSKLDEETINFAVAFGFTDNMMENSHKKVTLLDMVKQIWKMIDTALAKSGLQELTSAENSAIRSAAQDMFGGKPDTNKQNCTLAMRHKELRPFIATILAGNIKKHKKGTKNLKANRKPVDADPVPLTSASALSAIGGNLPHAGRIAILQDVINGDESLGNLRRRCNHDKAVYAIQQFIIEAMPGVDTFEQATQNCPAFSDQFVESFTQSTISTKMAIPETLKSRVRLELKQLRRVQNQVCFFFELGPGINT